MSFWDKPSSALFAASASGLKLPLGRLVSVGSGAGESTRFVALSSRSEVFSWEVSAFRSRFKAAISDLCALSALRMLWSSGLSSLRAMRTTSERKAFENVFMGAGV